MLTTGILPGSLPDARQLFVAISGRATGEPSALTRRARELAELHAVLVVSRATPVQSRSTSVPHRDIATEIGRVVDAIDEWAAIHLPRERGAPMHTHSLGQVFSHVARTYVRAWRTILYSGRADLGHSAWSRLAEVIQGYATLRGEIQTGRRQLPLGWHGIPDRDG